MTKLEWDESEHPRDDDGKFTNGADSQTNEPNMEKTVLLDADVEVGEMRKETSLVPKEDLTITAESGTVERRDKKPNVTPQQIAEAKAKLKANGYPESGYLAIVDKAQTSGYGTYDIRTGKPVTLTDGYMVSFQVNKELGVHRDYTPEEYDAYVYECITRTGSMPYLGTYGNPEISFNAKSKKVAIQMMKDFNQASIYYIKKGKTINNNEYNKKTNPTEE